MNKKGYAKPALEVVETEIAEIVCTSPGEVTGVDTGGTGIGYGGGGTDKAQGRERGNSIWDD